MSTQRATFDLERARRSEILVDGMCARLLGLGPKLVLSAQAITSGRLSWTLSHRSRAIEFGALAEDQLTSEDALHLHSRNGVRSRPTSGSNLPHSLDVSDGIITVTLDMDASTLHFRLGTGHQHRQDLVRPDRSQPFRLAVTLWSSGDVTLIPETPARGGACSQGPSLHLAICRVCVSCLHCTGFGERCVNEPSGGRPESSAGNPCGCGSGQAGCRNCGRCERCCRQQRPIRASAPPIARESSSFPPLTLGARVIRGPTWHWGEQDRQGLGTIILELDADGWVGVRWDHGGENKYQYSADQHDVILASPDSSLTPDQRRQLALLEKMVADLELKTAEQSQALAAQTLECDRLREALADSQHRQRVETDLLQNLADLSKYQDDTTGLVRLTTDVSELERIAAELAAKTDSINCVLQPAKVCLTRLSETSQTASDRLQRLRPSELTLQDLKLLCTQSSVRIPAAALAALAEPGPTLAACTSAKDILSALRLEPKDYIECLRLFVALRQLPCRDSVDSSTATTATTSTTTILSGASSVATSAAATTASAAAHDEAATVSATRREFGQTVDQVCAWLAEAGYAQAVAVFRQQGVSGAMLAAADVPFASTLLAIPRKRFLQIKAAFLRSSGAIQL
eukprot:m.332455 g.332455  ORF g.332455 m.332455 type:complete len:630 (+) comp55637_c0_seq8:3-1892(+)